MSKRGDYYPQFYRAKRRRERAVLVVSTLTLVVVGVAAIIFLGIYINRAFLHPATLEQGVEQREELTGSKTPETPLPEVEVAPTGVAIDKAPAKTIDLADISEYAESVPEVSIILQGMGTPPPAEEVETVQEESESPVPASEEKAAQPELPPADEAAGETPPSGSGGEPAGQEAKPGAERETAPLPEKKEPAKPKPPVPKVSEYTFTVFAGIYESDAEAKKQKAHLRELGFDPGTLTRSQGGKKSYLVYVGEPLPKYELAEAVKKKLQEAGFSDAYILRKSRN